MPPRTWTDDDLRRAITSATSWSGVVRELGLVDSGNVRGQLRVAASRRRVDVTHLELRRRERWTDAELTAAVAEAINLHGVFRVLGLRVGGGAWLRLQEHIHRLQLDTSYWRNGPLEPPGSRPGPAPYSWRGEEFVRAVQGARSVRQIMALLGLDPDRKRGRRAVERRLRSLGIEPRSLRGQGWSAGEARPPRPAR